MIVERCEILVVDLKIHNDCSMWAGADWLNRLLFYCRQQPRTLLSRKAEKNIKPPVYNHFHN